MNENVESVDQVRMMGDRILIRKEEKDRFSKGGIFLEHAEDNCGTVLAVGPGAFDKKGKRHGMWGLKAGDKVFFSPHGNTRVQVAGEELIIIRRDSLMGVLDDGAH